MLKEGYEAPKPRADIKVPGRSAYPQFRVRALRDEGGGADQRPRRKDRPQDRPHPDGRRRPAGTLRTEQELLDMEREEFLSLCGEEKTQARITHMLMKGKPLRN
jgi:3-hydroxyacyl-CoA dehydrogenase